MLWEISKNWPFVPFKAVFLLQSRRVGKKPNKTGALFSAKVVFLALQYKLAYTIFTFCFP